MMKGSQIESIECTQAEYELCRSYNGSYVAFRANILVWIQGCNFNYCVWKNYPPDLERFESENGVTQVISEE